MPPTPVIPQHSNPQLIGDPVAVINAAENAFRTIQTKIVTAKTGFDAFIDKIGTVTGEAADALEKFKAQFTDLHNEAHSVLADTAGTPEAAKPAEVAAEPAGETTAPVETPEKPTEVDPNAGPKDETPAEASNETKA